MRLVSRFLAEFTGTFAIVLLGAGAVCADEALRAAGGQGMGLLGIALVQGLAYAVMISAFCRVSGGHLNPAVTVAYWVTRRLSTFDGALYFVAQILGGMAAASFLTMVVPESTWRVVSLGSPELSAELSRAPGIAIEAVLTFLFVMVFMMTVTRKSGAEAGFVGAATGLTAVACILAGGPFTGAAMNPARVFGPSLVSHHWANQGVYWVGPLLGGVIAGWLTDRIFLLRSESQ